MSGLGNALPKAEWLAWLQSVFDPHRKAVNEALEDHDERLSSVAASVVALDRAQGAQDAHLDDLDARVRRLEGLEPVPEPDEPEEPPEEPTEPQEPQEPPGEPTEPQQPPAEPEPVVRLLGVGSASGSLREYPRAEPVTTGKQATRTDEVLALLDKGERAITLRGGEYDLPAGLEVTYPNLTLAAYGDERVILNRRHLARTDERNAAIFVTPDASGFRLVNIEIKEVPERTGSPHSSYAILVMASGARIENPRIHSGATGCIALYQCDDALVLDADIWNNAGAGSGTNMPDGISVPKGRLGRRHKIIRPFIANAPDDGIDFFGGVDCEVVDFVVVGCGYSPEGRALGDGSGVKMGGYDGAGGNKAVGGLAVGNKGTGLNHNSTRGGPTNVYERVTSVQNRQGVIADTGVYPRVHEVIAHANTRYDVTILGQNSRNTWDLEVDDPRFADPAGFDWSLLAGSPLVRAGAGGGPTGASEVALRNAKVKIPLYKPFIPGVKW